MIHSIRTFIGARDFDLSRQFYLAWGFIEVPLGNMSYFRLEGKKSIGFYLQKAYVKDWVDNSMIFLEVDNLEEYFKQISRLDLPAQFEGVRLLPIINNDWGSEFFLYDPSGILWHIGAFK